MELGLILLGATSAVLTSLTQNQCLKIIESVYGKDERVLVGRLFKKIKDYMAWEREVLNIFEKFL